MLRLAVLLLLLANAGYFAWSQGLLRAWGFAPAATGEPQRLQQQIQPRSLRILREDEVRSSALAPLARTECLLAGPLDAAQAAAVQAALQGWPAGSWATEPASPPRAGPAVQFVRFPALDPVLRARLAQAQRPLADLALRPCRAAERTAP